ncbi:hypothetical protein ElyMa_001784800 [Elysia marginata]|uniref:Uncharacterized protein n=1 Tax=Elysia marginata TaxID=1093978 RepID=A0AAV4EDG3_9GAST|nr:hypothetical protein ElyMa_001784800 [Elysia marginata]
MLPDQDSRTKVKLNREKSNVFEADILRDLRRDDEDGTQENTLHSNSEPHEHHQFHGDLHPPVRPESHVINTQNSNTPFSQSVLSNANTTYAASRHLSKRNSISKGVDAYLSNIQHNIQDAGKQAALSAAEHAFFSAFHLPKEFQTKADILVAKVAENINGGMKGEAAILDAALPMIKELFHVPDGRPGSSQLSLDKVLDHQSQCALDFERSVAAFIAKKRWAYKCK